MNDVKNRIQKLGEIPTLPAVSQKLLSVVESERSGVKDLSKVIRNDPALTSKILKLANSAYYGRFKKVSTVEQAVMTVGFNEIKSICLSMGIFGSFAKLVDPSDLQKFWVHALSSAVAIQEIGDRKQECTLEKIYYGGLMHDIGKLVLLLFFTDEYLDLIDRCESASPSMEEEKRAFGANHSQAGKWLSEHWNFPNELAELITYHHSPNKQHLLRPKSIATVYLADRVAHQSFGDSYDAKTEFCERLLRISSEELEEIGHRVAEQQPRIEETFSLLA